MNCESKARAREFIALVDELFFTFGDQVAHSWLLRLPLTGPEDSWASLAVNSGLPPLTEPERAEVLGVLAERIAMARTAAEMGAES